MSTQPSGGTISGNSSNVITDQQLFDQAVSEPSPAPASQPSPSPGPSSAPPTGGQPSAQPPSTRPDLQQQPPDPGAQPRTPQGQFAAKPPAPKPPQGQQHQVPLRELMEERERRQRLEAHTQELTRAVMALQQQLLPQQQPQQPQGPQTIYDDPDAYLDQRVMNPLRQEGQVYMMQIKDGLSREMANNQFGVDEVNAALEQMAKIRHTPQGNFAFNQIMSSGHPYGQLVQWHRTARAQAAIGADPQKWLQAQQQKWANDPKVQDYIMSLVQKRNGGGAQPRNPGNAGNPGNVELPPSLSSIRSSGNRSETGDLSSASLYSFATR